MKRTTKIKEEPEGSIERGIIIELIVNDDYTREILKIGDPIQLLESGTAKLLARWCIEYFKKYDKVPNKDIEGIYYAKLKEGKQSKDLMSEIEEEILPSLSKQYEQKGVNQFLLDQTIAHFKYRQAEILKDNLEAALQAGNLDTFNSLRTEFKPIQSNISKDKQFNATEVYSMEIKPTEWLINELLPRGLTIFGGKSKLGKSFLMLNMAMNLAQNEWMFSDESSTGFRGRHGAILYLSLEDNIGRIQKRMRVIDPDPNELLSNLDFRFEWDKLNSGGLTAIENWIKEKKSEKKRPKLVIIDVLAKVWNKSTKTSGGNLYAEEYSIYGPLSKLANDYKVSIIVITHTTKGKVSIDPFDEILGGSGMQGPADNLMLLSRTKEGKIQLSIRGKDTEEKHLLFDVSNEGANWYCLGESYEVQKTDQRQSIYEFLSVTGPSTFQEIKQAVANKEIDISPNSVARILSKMVMDGALEHSKRNGSYAIIHYGENKTNLGINERLNRQKSPLFE